MIKMLNPAIEPENQIPLHNLIDNLPETEKPTLRRILELLANLNSLEQSKAEKALQMFEQILENRFNPENEEKETQSPERILPSEDIPVNEANHQSTLLFPRKRQYQASEIIGKFKHLNVSTETIMRNKHQEIELEEAKHRRIWGEGSVVTSDHHEFEKVKEMNLNSVVFFR